MEEAAHLDSESKKSTLEVNVRQPFSTAQLAMAARANAAAGLGRAPRTLSIGAPPGHASAGGPLIHASPDAAEDGRAAGDARFEVAAAEEQERSAEEQERERCAAGERAMALVEIGSTFTCSLTSRVLEVSLL